LREGKTVFHMNLENHLQQELGGFGREDGTIAQGSVRVPLGGERPSFRMKVRILNQKKMFGGRGRGKHIRT